MSGTKRKILTPLLLVGNELNEDQDKKGAVENNVCEVHSLLCQARDQEFNVHRRSEEEEKKLRSF